MKRIEFFMDDSSLDIEELTVETNQEKVKNHTYYLGSSVMYSHQPAPMPTQLGNTLLSDEIIL